MLKVISKIGILQVIILFVVSGIIQASGSALAQSATPAATAAAAPPDVIFPDLTGPYKVGRTSFEWIDQSRPETFAGPSGLGLKRDLMVYIYFPASVTKRTKIAPYMDGGLMWDIWSGMSGRGGRPCLAPCLRTLDWKVWYTPMRTPAPWWIRTSPVIR
jgi:hypothetical protein